MTVKSVVAVIAVGECNFAVGVGYLAVGVGSFAVGNFAVGNFAVELVSIAATGLVMDPHYTVQVS